MLHQSGILVVEDMARDRRFAQSALVKEHGFRFYAGAPLRSADSLLVGSLCILDYKARRFGENERRILTISAEDMVELIESRISAELPTPT